MKCSQQCPNPASHTFYANGNATNVCEAHLYAQKQFKHNGTYIVRPRTLEAHIADYKEKSRV